MQRYIYLWLAAFAEIFQHVQVYSFKDLSSLVNDSVAAYKAGIVAGSNEIISLVAASRELLNVAPAAEPWLAYMANIATVIIDGLTEMLLVSLRYLLTQASFQLI